MTARRIPSADEVWRTYDAVEARLTAPVSERMVELAGIERGMRVLDLATGRGEPALAAARRVAPGGSVLGVDVSQDMLEMARARAAREGITNLELRVMNAAALDDALEPAFFDAAFCRWGLMYMDAPLQALAATSRALRPGGIFVATVWAQPGEVPYFTLPRRVLERYRALPPIDFDAPGTFRYADPERLRQDLHRADLDVVHEESTETFVMEAASPQDLIAWARAFGLTRLLNELPEQVQRAWETDFIKEAATFRKDGFFRLGGLTRIVVARRRVPPAER